jgi:general stress protein YciG
MSNTEQPKRPRGFAAISPERVREIARKGGTAAHLAGTAHEFTPEEARLAGSKGGLASAAKKKAAKEATSLPEDEKTTIRP